MDEGTTISSPKRMRDTQKVTREAREGTTYSYLLDETDLETAESRPRRYTQQPIRGVR